MNCRAGVLPVGETSRSDSGGGVSAEECSRRVIIDVVICMALDEMIYMLIKYQ